MGNSKLAGIAAEDIGKVAYGIFKAGSEYVGKTVGIVGENLTGEQMGEKIAQGSRRRQVRYNAVDADTYRGFGFPGADDMGNMFQVYREFEKEVLGGAQRGRHAVSSTRSSRTSTSSSRRTRARSDAARRACAGSFVARSKAGEAGRAGRAGASNCPAPAPPITVRARPSCPVSFLK